MDRPYFNFGIVELENLFTAHHKNPEILKNLDDELIHRSTHRANRLHEQVREAINKVGKGTTSIPNPKDTRSSEAEAKSRAEPEKNTATPSDESQPETGHDDLGFENAGRSWEEMAERDFPLPDIARPLPPISNRPDEILSAWLAWEVLSPQTYRRAEDLADGERWRVAEFEKTALPWDGKLENARPKTNLFYQIYLGAIRMERATKLLLRAFDDHHPERPEPRDFAALAVITTDREGKPVEDGSVAISSFGWALPHACRRDLEALKHWPKCESELTRILNDRLKRYDDDGELLPLSKPVINDAFRLHLANLGLPDYLVAEPSFAIRVYQWKALNDAPEPALLNSFFLTDLELAQSNFVEGNLGLALRKYLGEERPQKVDDFLRDQQTLEQTLRPMATPIGRWPSVHSLVLLQQAAVNAAFNKLSSRGIMGINGPPGSGKTTLLRDIVAAVVVERAQQMAKLDDPELSFEHSGQQIRAGQAFCHLYRVSETVKGHEIVVASSNNKAVENISRELPGRSQIAADDLSYFKSVSDALAGDAEPGETWGLIAAVLGNAVNRSRFRRTVWGEPDTSLNNYFRAASGSAVQPIEEEDPKTGETIERLPRILELEDPPDGRPSALRRWHSARKAFLEAVSEAKRELEQLEETRIKLLAIGALRNKLQDIEKQLRRMAELIAVKGAELAQAEVGLKEAERSRGDASRVLSEHRGHRPGFFSRLFSSRQWKEWKKRDSHLFHAWKHKKAELSKWQNISQTLGAELGNLQRENEIARSDCSKAKEELVHTENKLEAIRSRIGPAFADDAFWSQEHGPRQKSTPWLIKASQEKRDIVFKAAISLQRAFLDVCAKQVRHNLMALFQTFLGKKLGTPEKDALLPDLWATLFLVTPVVSTTFASVNRMLGRLPIESLGWLLIDEAGQAVPQAAAGAIMRSRRVVVVGDPRQIEPVVTLSDSLVAAIARDFGVEPDAWAVGASTQTLADAASSVRSEIEDETGAVTIGAPLLVHRRCEEPMFAISNRIAYAGQMVQATPERTSEIRDLFGPSRWINIQGIGQSKWCAGEGECVLAMLKMMAERGVESPDIFIITPFRVVRREMINLCMRERELFSKLTSDVRGWASERIGTVHTFQGKEAEAVIFLLGAPNEDQSGARQWAGARPNLLNVAVTRAKSVLYVVGNRERWRSAGCFSALDRRMP